MRIVVARSVGEMDSLRTLWDELYRQDAGATLFQSFAWNRLAAQCFAGRETPHVVAVEGASGAAIVPAVTRRDGIALSGEKLFDYRDALCQGDEAALRVAWGRLAELGLPCRVLGLRGQAARERWNRLQPVPFVAAPQVLRREVAADHFAAHHARLGASLRRLAREGASLHRYCGAATSLVRWIYQQKARQIESTENVFADPRRIDFMQAAAAMEAAACEVFTAEAAGSPVAALVTLRDRDVRRFYTIWYDRAWARRSPGTALLFEVTRQTLTEGVDCDYMTGEQPHKARFMTSQVELFQVNADAAALWQAAGEMDWTGRDKLAA